MRSRVIGFLLFCALTIVLYSSPLTRLIKSALHHGYSSHIVLIPIITVYLIWSAKASIFASPQYSFLRAVQIGVLAALAVSGRILFKSTVGSSAMDILIVLSMLLLLVAGFVGFFGTAAFRKALFPFSMLLFMLPVPSILLGRVIYFLQSQSAELTYWMFTVLKVPVLRDGFVMTLPGATIQVAEECSGINSSVALLILMIIFAHETLKSSWRRVLLVLLVIPLSVLKNAIRIVTLTLLATKVDPSFLTGRLHHQGGFVFFLLTLALVYPIWSLLHNSESQGSDTERNQTAAAS